MAVARNLTFSSRRDASWVGRAIGELLLIVVGVLLALAVDNWNTDRTRHRTELQVLRDMRSAVLADLESLRGVQAAYAARVERIDALVAALRSGARYEPRLDAGFGAAYGLQPLILNRAPYEGLKSSGMDLVADDPLRAAIVDAYEHVYARIEMTQQIEEEVTTQILRPYFLREFRDLKLRDSATPLRPAAVMTDSYFLNVLEYRVGLLKSNNLRVLQAAIPALESLVQRIDAALPSGA